ncbi:hypothetical protein RvY_01910 [Ramazzottius varieornatus]|uniref:Endonuclease/exonuclease/phosphatase domain-containing protein n=1 Tax=Ramazzottius varieornatus TaxID=947166 RepID=A0A1D1USL3_RAMVA|nr:hypothetical protein RvY_01910 [Ramazzottius varieornatus]
MPPVDYKGAVSRKLVLRYANVNGIRSKSEEVKRWIDEGDADIVALVDTIAGDSTADCLMCDLDRYNLHRLDRTGCQKETGGGVALIMKRELQAIRMPQFEVSGLEVLWVKVVALRMNLLVGVIYAPGYDVTVFSDLRASMEKIPFHLRRNILLVGDFNCPTIQWDGNVCGSSERDRDLILLKNEFKLFQRVRETTRQRGDVTSTLDLLFVAQLGLVRNARAVKPPSVTNDHFGIQCSVILMTPKLQSKPKLVWKIDECAAKSSFQLRSVTSRRLHRPSLSGKVVVGLRTCRGAYTQWRRTRDQADFQRWKELEAVKKRLILADKYRKLRGIAFSSRRDPTAVWKFLKKNSASASIPPIPIPGSDDKYLIEPQDKANSISDLFAKEYCEEPTVATSTLLTLIRKLDPNKAAGSSLVTNRLLKIAGTTIIYPLSRLFNLILCTGKYPAAWKTADVVPVPKKGGSTLRPISLLPPLSKLFEKVLSDHINSFLDRNKLLSDTQYGFMRRRSTEMQLFQSEVSRLPSSKVKSPVFQYADDILLYRIIRKNDDCAALQQDVNGIAEWCIETGLEVNPRKS